jgi:DNA repair exonuclease SbcCD ATPase subunit
MVDAKDNHNHPHKDSGCVALRAALTPRPVNDKQAREALDSLAYPLDAPAYLNLSRWLPASIPEYEYAQKNLATLRERIAALEADVTLAKEETAGTRSRLMARIEDLRAERDRLRADNKRLRDANKGLIQGIKDGESMLVKGLRERIAALEGDLEVQTNRFRKARDRRAALEAERDSYKESYSQQVDAGREAFNELKAKYESVCRKYDMAGADYANLRAERDRLKSEGRARDCDAVPRGEVNPKCACPACRKWRGCEGN